MSTQFSTVSDIADFLIFQLEDIPHSVYRSKSTNSVYVRFACGTLSIRDHVAKCRNIPRPRWSLVMGYHGKKRKTLRSGRAVLFYNEYGILDCVSDIRCAIDRRSVQCDTATRRKA